MNAVIVILLAIFLVVNFSGETLAVDRSFSRALQHMEIKGSDSTDLTWFLVAVLAIVVVAGIVSHYYRRGEEESVRAPRATKKKIGPNFRQRTAALGFKLTETKILRRATARLAPQRPESLLTTETGRRRLITDFEKRIRRHEREIEVLRTMMRKLEKMNDQDLHDRDAVRVEADLPVWIIKKVEHVIHNREEENEDVFENIEPVEGRLVDLSEGGAAVSVDLAVRAGDLLEFWSADTEIWLPPITGGVVQVEKGKVDGYPVLHLHFLDAHLGQLRPVIQELQSQNDPEAIAS